MIVGPECRAVGRTFQDYCCQASNPPRIAHRRDAKIRKLTRSAQKLLGILDATFDRTAQGIIRLDRLGGHLWEDGQSRLLPTTTLKSRNKKT